MILFDEFTQWALRKRERTERLINRLLHWDHRVNMMISGFKGSKDYEQLQLLEEALRQMLVKTLEAKGEVAVALMKKDFEMNKDLIAKIQGPASQQSDTQKQHPRFGLN